LIPVEFGYGDEDEFFLRGWVWDSETRPRPAPLSSVLLTLISGGALGVPILII